MASDAAIAIGKMDAAADLRRQKLLNRPPRLDRPTRFQLLAASLRSSNRSTNLRKIIACLRGPGRLTLDEIFYYRLLDDDLDLAAAVRFVGKRAQRRFHAQCRSPQWIAASRDKVLFYTIMAGARLPTPETLALFGHQRAGFDRIAPGGLGDFLRHTARWPLFAKPIRGIYSLGAMKLVSMEGEVVTIDGVGQVSIEALEQYMTRMSPTGYMLQSCLRPSKFCAEHLFGSLSSVRVLLLIGAPGDLAGIAVESAVLKISGPGATADNYWRPGNAMAAIDLASGRLTRAITGTGSAMRVLETHPHTGRRFAGLMVPDWAAILDVARTAASAFPRLRTQSWDIALTDQGPRLLEMNHGGDLNLHQLAHRRGALTPSFCEHLRRCGWARSLPH